MALKKRKICKSEADQLYMLEILVERVDLCPGKQLDAEDLDCLMVRVEFIDLTPVDITAEEFIKAARGERCKNKESRLLADQSGKSCLFTRAPSNLIRSIKSTPLSVEVYRIPRMKDRNSCDDGSILLCAATAFLPRCFADRVAEAKGKMDGLSEPYTLKKAYTLTDERGFPCGSASIHLRLSCFGSSIIDHFTFRQKSFVLQDFPLGEKFRCVRQSDKSAIDDTFPSSEVPRAAYSEPHDQEDASSAPLTRPQSAPRVSMDQPGFEKLTSAEKLNDRRYRSLVYAAYPDEPTCSCLPTNRSTHPLMCRSGCLRSCCMALRNPDILQNNVPVLSLPADHVSDPSSGVGDDTNPSDDPTRMRGGGEKEDIRSKHVELATWSGEYARHGDNINLKQRLMGGSEYPPSEMVTTVLYEKNKETSAGTTCRPRPRSADGVMTGCTCPGKDPLSGRTGTIKCAKKPCVGADCMIRAFREAQDFVNSLDKVLGMTGLGLMDPSDSPYFGRGYGAQDMPRRGYPAAVATTSPNLQYTAPCTQTGGATALSYAPIAAAAPVRGGVVREAIPMLPETPLLPLKPKKKEDKKEEKAEKQKEADVAAAAPSDVEVGPCGEAKCKSSRRKTPGNGRSENGSDSHKKETARSKSSPSSVPVKSVASNPGERARRPRNKPNLGAGGDRDDGKVPPVKASKRVMRYVYTIGEVYPGISYGHKNCVDPRMRVPANMGWLWNTTDTASKLKPRIGWRPGAIGHYLYELLKEAKGSLVEDSRARSVPSRTAVRRGKAFKPMGYASAKEGEVETEPPPTLHIHRKDGTYYVTMYPIKGETADDTPRLEKPTKPLQLKITRSRNDASVASSSTASDMELEFSPPAAVNRYRKKPDVVHVDTQVRQQEILDALKPPETPRAKKEKKGKEKKEKERREKKGKK
ncbi:PREDICTED: uncharacterized protein LOC106746992 [Dinoponera quadriceps]|uniref:Uncharacterized protein LOC106746992 n=1 Tax=Dinoponera quadriceps TaxID=609295 RepID=A0A6P3XNX8_DINQU|nr:PREDICTED: uncharacterized protein LOC106746992 [Dinoponera quadriceps]